MDELEPRDLATWEVDDLPADFADRVMARLRVEPSPSAMASVHPPQRRRRVLAVVAATVAVAAAIVLAWGVVGGSPPRTGMVAIADEPAVVAPWPGVEAVVSPGGAMSWEVTDDQVRVEQAEGRVRYQVTPGTAVSVHTPAGTIDVTGTLFTVEVLAVSDVAKRNSRLLLATAAAATVLTIVVVHEGSVDASNERGTAEITAGSRAVMSDASGPRLEPEPPLQVVQAPEPPAPTKRYASPEQLRRHAAAREQIQQALAQRAAARPEPSAPAAEEPEEEPSALPSGLRTRIEGNLDKAYIREAVRKDLIPLAHDCYSSVLATDPKFAGTLVLEFDIMGDEDVGGIVDGVVPGEGTDVANPEFIECMSESMMTVIFPPPVGGGMVHVSYPLLFEPE
jgi:hypothetical protein